MATQPATTNVDVDVVVSAPVLRIEALDRAVRVALSGGRIDSDAQIVMRAAAFANFLEGKTSEGTDEERPVSTYA